VSGPAPLGDPWVASGHHLCDRDAAGRLVPTPDLWRAFLARPELLPPEEACAAEFALHTTLLADPLRPVSGADLSALADPDARENWVHFLRFRDRWRRRRPWKRLTCRCSAVRCPASRPSSSRC
jgi:hypothetical protein